MIAIFNERRPRPVLGVNTVVRRDGSTVHLDDIETSSDGQILLDEIDEAILAIEDQLDRWNGGHSDPTWEDRARAALKKKRRIRPALQQRIGELRKAERLAAAPPPPMGIGTRNKAFVTAAEELLDREVYTEIWVRAAEIKPEAFANQGGPAA